MSRQDLDNIETAPSVVPRPALPDYASQSPEPDGLTPHELLAILIRRWRIMLVTLVITLALGALFTVTRRPIYESSARVVVVTSRAGCPAAADDIPLVSDLQALTRSRSVDTQVEIVSSPDLLEESFNSLGQKVREDGFRSKTLPDWACKVTAKRNTDVINITGRAYTPVAAPQLANTIANTYFKRDLKQSNQATRQARVYAEQKMAIAEKELAQANAELSKFKQKTGLIAPDVQLIKTAEAMAQLSLDLDAAKAEVFSSERGLSELQGQLGAQQPEVAESTTVTRNPRFSSILEKIDQLNSERISLLQEFTPKSREVQRVDACIAQERERLKQMAETIVGTRTSARNRVRDDLVTKYATDIAARAAGTARVKALSLELDSRKADAGKLPEQQREFTERMRRVALLERSYEMLSTKYYTLLLSEQAVLPNGILISQARLPEVAAYPNPKTNAGLFLLLGLVLSVAVAITAERLDCRVRDQSLVERLSGLPTLSVVPNITEGSAALMDNKAHNSALLESFRILRNNISFSSVGRDLRLLAVTSAGPGEGKTTISVNLAVAMAMEGKRVLILDCDLRRPAVHKIMKVARNVGFTNVVTGGAKLEDAVSQTSVENLFCMPSGPIPPNPVEFLNSQQSRRLLDQLARQYDLVIVDCPPCTGLSDVQVISTIVDGILLVVSMNETLKPQLHMAIRTMTQAEAPLMGTVLNRMDARHQGYGYHYYYYYYDYSEDASLPSERRHSHKRKHKKAA